MAKLSFASRAKLPKTEFGEPGARKYPMPDRKHAANAKARASQAVNAGRMSKSTEDRIDAKANRMLGKHTGSEDRIRAAMTKPKAPAGHEHLMKSKHFRGM